MTVQWMDAMNADIKRYFNIDPAAEILDIDTAMRDEPAGGNDYWSVFVVEVTFRVGGKTRTEVSRGTVKEFLEAVAEEAARTEVVAGATITDSDDGTENEPKRHYWNSTPPY